MDRETGCVRLGMINLTVNLVVLYLALLLDQEDWGCGDVAGCPKDIVCVREGERAKSKR